PRTPADLSARGVAIAHPGADRSLLATVTTSYDQPVLAQQRRGRTLRQLVAGAAPFDGLMGVTCLAAAGRIADWLSIGSGLFGATGGTAGRRRPERAGRHAARRVGGRQWRHRGGGATAQPGSRITTS